MKCPACQREMQKGYFIDGDAPIQWIPEGRKPPLFKGEIAEGSVALGGGSFWKSYRAEAYYCPYCRFVLIPANNP